MQKLTYINLYSQQIVFYHAPYVLSKIEGLGLPELETETISGVYQQGNTVAGYRRAGRTLTVTFSILESSREALYARRMELMDILSPDKAVLKETDDLPVVYDPAVSGMMDDRAILIYENDFGRYMTYAVPDGGLDVKNRVLNTQPGARISFRCESPYWFDVNKSFATFAYSGEGLSLPFSFPVLFGLRDYAQEAVNSGQVSVPVELTVFCQGEAPRLYNQTTGKRISFVTAVPSGNRLVLNTDPARLGAKVVDGNGNETGAFGFLSLDTPLAEFVLKPGVNTLQYEAGGADAQSTIIVSWRNAYEGV